MMRGTSFALALCLLVSASAAVAYDPGDGLTLSPLVDQTTYTGRSGLLFVKDLPQLYTEHCSDILGYPIPHVDDGSSAIGFEYCPEAIPGQSSSYFINVNYYTAGRKITYRLIDNMFPSNFRGAGSNKVRLSLWINEHFMLLQVGNPSKLSRLYTSPIFFGIGRGGMISVFDRPSAFAGGGSFYTFNDPNIAAKIDREWSGAPRGLLSDFTHDADGIMSTIEDMSDFNDRN